MKNLIYIIFAGVFLLGCSKDEDTPQPPAGENPLETFLSVTGFNQNIYEYIDDKYYVFGMRFTPKVNGKITDVTLKIPNNDNSTHLISVNLWDVETQEVLRTASVLTLSNTGVKESIEPLSVTKDKEYMITFNTDDYYEHSRNDGEDIAYPVTAGNIIINGLNFQSGQGEIFPTANTPLDFYLGDCGFIFVKD
ncbi:MAG: DUF4082 domain-containing protein [Flavobacteriaceae bacterium]|nr:DUF4082 domain-containing protein [Flavobacteriaceae bacterium]